MIRRGARSDLVKPMLRIRPIVLLLPLMAPLPAIAQQCSCSTSTTTCPGNVANPCNCSCPTDPGCFNTSGVCKTGGAAGQCELQSKCGSGGRFCTTSSCVGGQCVDAPNACPTPVNQANPCDACAWDGGVATCDENNERWNYVSRTGSACDDNDPCTIGDQCITDGGCTGARYTCTATECQLSSACGGDGGCVTVNKSNGVTCGDACTVGGSCQTGVCANVQPRCPDPDECHAGICKPDGGCDVFSRDSTPCDAGTCRNGTCTSGSVDAGGAQDAGDGDAGATPDAGDGGGEAADPPSFIGWSCGCASAPAGIAAALWIAGAAGAARRMRPGTRRGGPQSANRSSRAESARGPSVDR